MGDPLTTGRHESDICIDQNELKGINHSSETTGCLCYMPIDQFRLMVCEALREWALFSLPYPDNHEIVIARGQRSEFANGAKGAPLNPVHPDDLTRPATKEFRRA